MSDNWEQKVRKGLVCAGIDDVTAHKLPIEPAGHYTNPHLPDRIHWLGYLWLCVLKYAKTTANLATLVNTQNYLNASDALLPSHQESYSDESEIIIDEKNHPRIFNTLMAPIKELIKHNNNKKKARKIRQHQ